MPIAPVAFPPTLTGIELDPNHGLSKQLYEILRQQVLDGRLVAACVCPPVAIWRIHWASPVTASYGPMTSCMPRVLLKGALATVRMLRSCLNEALRLDGQAVKTIHQLTHRCIHRVTHRFVHNCGGNAVELFR